MSETILCRTPTPGKAPTRINTQRFDLYRAAILNVLKFNPAGVAFQDLTPLVLKHFAAAGTRMEGSVMWNVTVVKLEMEVRGEIARDESNGPQRLRLSKVR